MLTDFLHTASITLQNDLVIAERESNQSLGEEGTALLLAMNARYPWYSDAGYNQDRGMVRRQHLFYKAMRESGAGPLRVNVLFDEAEAQNFNLKIDFLNSLLPKSDRFDEVAASTELTKLPDSSAISAEYVVELVNGLSHLVDDMADRTDHLQNMKAKFPEN
ncbi:MAG: hypothetical protein HOM95_05060 [Halieaceae bacterium]|nr:hypothetical protein [Halieaceae bacterium]